MLIVNVKENESIDKALKRFKKKFEKTGVLKELRARTSFEKPSVSRRNEIIRAAYREQQRIKEFSLRNATCLDAFTGYPQFVRIL
jgi:small subunit ribosomal protein S21